MPGFKSYRAAAATPAGIEVAHRTGNRARSRSGPALKLLVAEEPMGQGPGVSRSTPNLASWTRVL